MYKLTFYVPESHLEPVKKVLFETGAGRYELYDQCCWQTLGLGQFRPLEGSQPHIGDTNQLETVAEYKVEMICTEDRIADAVNALKEAHPYETPSFDVLRLEHFA